MSRLVLIRDVMAPYNREILTVPIGYRPREVVPKDFPTDQIHIIHNGKVIENNCFLDDYLFRHRDDEVILTSVPGDPLNLGWIGYVISAVVLTAVSTGIRYAIAALTTPARENKQGYDSSMDSPVYTWEGIQNTTRNGAIIPLLYGVHRVGGHILSAFTKEVEEGQTVLHMLIGLCAGPVASINGLYGDVDDLADVAIPSELKINNNPANLFKSVKISQRMGNAHQSIIPGFNDVTVPYDVDTDIEITTSSPTQFYTTHDEVQAIDLIFSLPSGLYRFDDEGAFLQYEASIRIRYKPEDATAWSAWETVTFSGKTRSTYRKQYSIEHLTQTTYIVEMERITPNDDQWTTSFIKLVKVNEIKYDDIAYNGIALVGIKAIPTEQLHGHLPTVTSVVHGKEVVVYDPGDQFSDSTQQDLLANIEEKQLYGWYAQNTNPTVDLAKANEIIPVRLWCQHSAETTRQDAIGHTAPFFFKKVYGDFDVSVRGAFIDSESTPGDGVGLMIQDPEYDHQFVWIGLYNDAGTIKWRIRSYGYQPTAADSGETTYDECYYRIVKTGYNATFYTSIDGESWVERGSVGLTQFIEYYKIGCVFFSETSATSDPKVDFQQFTFASDDSYSVETTSNPAWVIYDLLTDIHYGLGNYIETSQIDISTFISFAAYCDELVDNGRGGEHARYQFHGVLDSSKPAWDKLIEVMELYRAGLVRWGNRLHIIWHRQSEVSQVFSVANIKQGTFVSDYRTPEIDANLWGIQYCNAERDWEQDFTSYIDPFIPENQPIREKTTSMYGVTRHAEANRGALFRCKFNRYVTQVISFETGTDTIRCEPFDIISVSHSLPAWGESGRVLTSTPTSIELDKPVTLDADAIYEITIRHANDTIETQTVTNSAGITETITVGSWTLQPAEHEIWVVGRKDILTKPFVVSKITKTNDLECKIEAFEYNPLVYDDTVEDIPFIPYTDLPDPRTFPGDVSHLTAVERAQVMKDGSVQSVVDVTWTAGTNAVLYHIYYREKDRISWLFAGMTEGTHFVLMGDLREGITYEIACVSVGPYGSKKHPDLAPRTEVLIQGKMGYPPDVEDLNFSRIGETLILTWAPVIAVDLQGYEIRANSVDEWQGATVKDFVVAPATTWLTSDFAPGEAWYLVKAVNRSGIPSLNAASVYVEIGVEDAMFTRNEKENGWDGYKTNMSIVGHDLLLDEGYTTGSYETVEMDVGASVTALVSVNYALGQYEEGYTWATATFTWASVIAQNTTWVGAPGGNITGTLYFKYSSTSPITGDYQLFQMGTYIGRYYQFKMVVQTDSVAYRARLQEMEEVVNPPDITEGGTKTILASGSTQIDFESFNVKPQYFVCTPIGGNPGDTTLVTELTKDYARVQYYNSSQVQVQGVIDWTARGY